MPKLVCIVGAGVMGRLLAVLLGQRDWRVTLIDQGEKDGKDSCSWTGCGDVVALIGNGEGRSEGWVFWTTISKALAGNYHHA